MVSARFSNVVSEALYLSENLPLKVRDFLSKCSEGSTQRISLPLAKRSISSLYILGTFSSMKKSLIFLDPPPTDIQSPFLLVLTVS